MQVGWRGLGAMGAPMAARAARAGHVGRGYDVVPGRAAFLAADGVRPADTVAAAIGGADLIVIMVATPEQVEQALFAPPGRAAQVRCIRCGQHPGTAIVSGPTKLPAPRAYGRIVSDGSRTIRGALPFPRPVMPHVVRQERDYSF